MRTWRHIALLLAVAVTAFPQAKRSYTLIFDQGKEACQTVSLPAPWIAEPISEEVRKEAQGIGLDIGQNLKFRRYPGEGDDSVLVTVYRDDQVESPHKYRVSLDPAIAIQPIDDTQWKSAQLFRPGDYGWEKHVGELTIMPVPNRDGSSAAIPSEFHGWITPNQHWGAILRWHGRMEPKDKGIPTYRLAPSIIAYRNEFSADLMDAATERRVVAFHGVFNGISAANILDNSGWLTNRIFWMPLDEEKQTILICDSKRFQAEGETIGDPR